MDMRVKLDHFRTKIIIEFYSMPYFFEQEGSYFDKEINKNIHRKIA